MIEGRDSCGSNRDVKCGTCDHQLNKLNEGEEGGRVLARNFQMSVKKVGAERHALFKADNE